MNKKHARIISVMLIVLLMIAGCGKETATYESQQSDANEGKQTENSVSTTVSSAEADVPGTAEETVEEESKPINIEFSDYDFSKCFYVSKDFFFVVNSDNLYELTDIETGLPVDKTFTVSIDKAPVEYACAFSGLQDLPGGYLLCTRKLSDSEGISVVFDKKTGETMASYCGPVKILNYIDGMIVRSNAEKTMFSFSTADQDIDEGYIIYGNYFYMDPSERDGRIWFIDDSNSDARLDKHKSDRTFEDYTSIIYSLDAKALREAVENGNANTVTLEDLDYQEHHRVPNDDFALESLSDSVSKDGWVHVYSYAKGPDGYMQNDNGGFYNVKTGEFVKTGKFSEDKGIPSSLSVADDTRRNVDEVNGIAVVKHFDTEIYNAMGTDPKRLFDIQKGEYIGDEMYLYIGAFGYSEEPVLVRNMEGKWGYLDNNTKLPVGDFHEDASAFCNGYAVVIDNGVGRVIDVNMNVLGEDDMNVAGVVEFDAQSVYTIQNDYYVDSDLDGKGIFVVTKPDGKKRLLTVGK